MNFVLVFLSINTNMVGCMATKSIDNHPLTQRSLQFIDIAVNKLTFKSINMIQSSINYNIVSGFICWNQNIVHMKIQDTWFKWRKWRFRIRDKRWVLLEQNVSSLKGSCLSNILHFTINFSSTYNINQIRWRSVYIIMIDYGKLPTFYRWCNGSFST